jgi:hypothetical protein
MMAASRIASFDLTASSLRPASMSGTPEPNSAASYAIRPAQPGFS